MSHKVSQGILPIPEINLSGSESQMMNSFPYKLSESNTNTNFSRTIGTKKIQVASNLEVLTHVATS